MSAGRETCHGQLDSLVEGSQRLHFNNARRVVWAVRNEGVWWTFQRIVARAGVSAVRMAKGSDDCRDTRTRLRYVDTLDLQPGELVEVKAEEEILATLDTNGRNCGLLWMRGMNRYCGNRYRVFRRVKTILLESNGQVRKMKNTVLLEGLTCDGAEFFDCDRSCFYYWREAWLRRVPAGGEEESGGDL